VFLSVLAAHAQEPLRVSSDPYDKWLNEDVRWIISDQERADFKKLWTDEQRDRFVIAFWDRRNPVPGAARNTFKEEHYHRLAYANQHFAQGVPGWKTDRGRFYIMYGPPDTIVRRQSSVTPRPDGLFKTEPSAEEWRWKHIAGLGCNVILVFEDKCGCGKYNLSVEASKVSYEKEVVPLLHTGPDCSVDDKLFPY
jgi:GWxTD domain-containing protein